MTTGFAQVAGTWRNPRLELSFSPRTPHPGRPRLTMLDWVRALPGRKWDPEASKWIVTGIGPNPDRVMAEAGFEVLPGAGGEFEAVRSLADLYAPCTMLAANKRTVLMRHRLAGYDEALRLTGPAAVWDKGRKLFRVPVADVIIAGQVRPGVIWTQEAIDRAYEVHGISPAVPGLEENARILGNATDAASVADAIRDTAAVVGNLPEWFGVELFGYQLPGALAVAAGHTGLFDAPGVGKALPDSEPVLTPAGFRAMGDLSAGDRVIGSNGHPTTVLAVYPQGARDIYCISFGDGAKAYADADHLWRIKLYRKWRTLSTRELMESGLQEPRGYGGYRAKNKFTIPTLTGPVLFERAAEPLPVEPYTLGFLLGDGHFPTRTYSATFSTGDPEIAAEIARRNPDWGVHHSSGYGYYLARSGKRLKQLGLRGSRSQNKRVPAQYLTATPEERLELLRGLMDSDGYVMRRGNTSQFTSVCPGLAQDVVYLVNSLGGTARTTSKDVPKGGNFRPYTVTIRMPSGMNPFHLRRKAEKWIAPTKYAPRSRAITRIEFARSESATCIKVAAEDGLFVMRDFVVTHNTIQFLAAAAVMRAERILILCPPVVLTNWEREVVKSGVAAAEQIAVVRAGRKEPAIAGMKVVVIGDSMLASRPGTAAKIVAWAPDLVGYDEIHRAKTIGSKRGDAVLDLIAAVPGIKRVALTGTPLMAGPHELVPILEFTGHMSSVFGGPSAFLARYCRQDKFGGWHARQKNLPELHRKLADHVWVRRTKEQVLPDLPKVSAFAVALDIDLALYRKAHAEVIDQLVRWVADFETANGRLPSRTAPGATGYTDEIAEYAGGSLRHVSQLRQAAGLTKIQTAAEFIQDHIAATTEVDADGVKTYTRPLVVWTHHKIVTEAMGAACAGVGGGVIAGGTSDKEKNRLVDAFQAGAVPVLVCSITAAGVGITLTRSSDVIFVENDWTPALISQAIDRCNRIGQANHITVRFLIALGTLDEHIQAVLETKGGVVSEVMGDTTARVGVMGDYEDLQTPQSIVESLVEEAIRRHKKTARAAGA